jgi:hypothetical protein
VSNPQGNTAVDFTAVLLGVLGHRDDEYTSLLYENGRGPRAAVMPPAKAVEVAATIPRTAAAYFGVCPVGRPAGAPENGIFRGRRGTAADVTRLAALWCDLDVKPRACADLGVAEAIVDELSAIMGTRPSARVYSGGGLHPYWTVDDGPAGDAAGGLLKRWGRLVAAVARRHGARVDNVFDLSRMMRLPGSVNHKNTPTPVVAYEDNGAPLTATEIDERLTEMGMGPEDDDTRATAIISDPGSWDMPDDSCGYITALIDGLPGDGPKPGAGRHPWLCSQAVRLMCAARLGCISGPDLRRAADLLAARFAQLCATTEPRREPGRFEIDGAWQLGQQRAAAKTAEQARAELGGHLHNQPPADAAQPATDPHPPIDGAAIDGAVLLDNVHAALLKYTQFANEHQPVAVTLWTAATHALPAWQHATRLAITSPTRRCGKSRLLDIVSYLCFRRELCGDASPAVLYRLIGNNDAETPTLLLDEADVKFGTARAAEQNEDLRGLFNNGWQRDRPTKRCVGPQLTPTDFNTFAMAALASKGRKLPDTITDRAVNIALDRRAPGQRVTRFRQRRDVSPLTDLRNQLTAWARAHLEQLKAAEFDLPGVEDRALDAWEPLLAAAEAAGGDWPNRARAACRALTAAADADVDDDLAVLLLHDIRLVFTTSRDVIPFSVTGGPFLPSAKLVAGLRDIEESPWSDEKSPTYLTTSKLAHRLKPFGVRPDHNATKTCRGYALCWFADAFARYLPQMPSVRPEEVSDQ